MKARRQATKPQNGAPKRRRVAVVTGSRAEYGLLRSTLREIANHPNLKLQLVVTGTHLLRKFGHTIDDIRRDGWRIDARVAMQRGDDRPLDQAEGLARGVSGIARFLLRAKTDVVVVLGDRIEAMAGALAGVTTGRLVAHIHGGDIAPGDFDDSLRHAITKLAHLHLTATQAARQRIVQMGEAESRVYWVGAPGLDRLVELERSRIKDGPQQTDRGWLMEPAQNGKVVSPKPPMMRRALIVQHPCGRSAAVECRVMGIILRTVEEAGLAAVCVYPNSDRGHRGIVRAIESHARRTKQSTFRVVRSLSHDAYLRLLVEADVLIGNSSSGIIEATAAGTPAVDVGSRQLGRERNGEYVVHAEETRTSIGATIRKALDLRPITGGANIYGDGRAGPRIARLLASVPLNDTFRRKVFTDHSQTRNRKRKTRFSKAEQPKAAHAAV